MGRGRITLLEECNVVGRKRLNFTTSNMLSGKMVKLLIPTILTVNHGGGSVMLHICY